MSKRLVPVISLFVVLALVLGACGGGSAAPTAAPAAVLAADTPTPVPPTEAPAATEAPVAEAPATEAPAEEAPAAEGADLTAVVGDFAAGIPEGWMNTGKIDDVKAAIDAGAYVIDVRETSEYEAGHIPGAVNIPVRTLAQNLDKVPADQPVLIYCASGHRAGMATAALRELGYDNVKAFSGGWKAWSGANEEASTEAVEPGSFTAKEVDPALLAAVDGFLANIPEGYYSLGTVEKLQEAVDAGAVLIDVREEGEFAEGAIAGAVNIPLRTLIANLDQIPTDKPVVTYCASGYRSALANGMLHTLGYDNVRSFPPGYGAWEAAQGESGEVPAEVAAAVASDFDIVTAVDEWLSAIPEGYLAVGKIDAFKDAIENTQPLLIDVREESEYAEGHIPGAINIPLRTLTANLDKIPADKPVFVYCASGLRAGTALASLGVLGYDNVKSFPPGWKGWSGANEPAETEPVTAETVTSKEVDPEMLAAVDEFLVNIPEGYYSLGTVEKMQEALDAGAQPLDVREASEFDQGHIASAPNIPIRTLAQNLDSIPTDKPVVVYCASGHRAAISNAALHIMGLDNVRAFPPGYGAWESAGGATE